MRNCPGLRRRHDGDGTFRSRGRKARNYPQETPVSLLKKWCTREYGTKLSTPSGLLSVGVPWRVRLSAVKRKVHPMDTTRGNVTGRAIPRLGLNPTKLLWRQALAGRGFSSDSRRRVDRAENRQGHDRRDR